VDNEEILGLITEWEALNLQANNIIGQLKACNAV
jgi:hypothetical protein